VKPAVRDPVRDRLRMKGDLEQLPASDDSVLSRCEHPGVAARQLRVF
jgi:hypothetical protein